MLGKKKDPQPRSLDRSKRRREREGIAQIEEED